MQDMSSEQWVKDLTGDTINAAASKAGVTPTTLFRQIERDAVTAEVVVKLARAYGVNEVDALASYGHIDPKAVATAGVEVALGAATNAQLLAEIERRVDPEAVRLFRGGGGEITPDFTSDEIPDPATLRLAARKSDPRPDDSADL